MYSGICIFPINPEIKTVFTNGIINITNINNSIFLGYNNFIEFSNDILKSSNNPIFSYFIDLLKQIITEVNSKMHKKLVL